MTRAGWAGLLFLLLFFLPEVSQAQDSLRLTPSELLILGDTIIAPGQDTLIILSEGRRYRLKANPYRKSRAFYDSIRADWSKNWITRELHDLFFRTPSQKPHSGEEIRSEAYFTPFRGKRIAAIYCVKAPIYEGSVLDTLMVAQSGFGRLINKVFRPTADPVILRNLLVETGEELNPFRLADSERILRSLPFIEDAKIYVRSRRDYPEEVVLTVVTKDRFRYGFDADISGLTEWRLGLANRSLFGSGHRLGGRFDYIRNREIQSNGISFDYRSPFLGKQLFTSITAFWSRRDDLRGQGITLSREFISPEVHYGGALSFLSRERLEFMAFSPDSIGQNMTGLQETDIWLGRSFELAGKEKRSNLAFTLRFLDRDFSNRPFLSEEFNAPFHDRCAWLGALIFRKLKFLKTSRLLTFGIAEEVPLGIQASLTVGYNQTEFNDSWYSELALSGARFFPSFGYLSAACRLGGFHPAGSLKNGILQASVQYFSPSLPVGRWSNRNFLIIHYRRRQEASLPLRYDLTDLSLRKFPGAPLRAESLLSVNIDHVWFSPWFFYGFRFVPTVFADFGFLQESRLTSENPMDGYYGFGAALRIRNESIALSSMELRFSFYPESPEDRNALFFSLSLSRPLLFESLPSFKPIMSGIE